MEKETNPYRISSPAIISFSGGRTSAYMLHQIIAAHGGALPDDVVVAFANTGKEREETLRFVHECGSRWGVRIYWLEWRDYKHAPYAEVDFASASRAGEPFQALIDKKQRLPNWQERWCTQFLKVIPLTSLATTFDWVSGQYAEVIGLRDDEGHRILRSMNNAMFVWDKKLKKEVPRDPPRKVVFPLAAAKITKADVMAFWAKQDFDLGLNSWEGNCDLCFMKGRAIKKQIIRDDPSAADWWSANENKYKGKQERGWFDKRDSIAGLAAEVHQAPDLFEAVTLDDEHDGECGLSCPSDNDNLEVEIAA